MCLHAVPVQIHVQVPGLAASRALAVRDVVAVVVLAVADLDGEVVDIGIQGRAVRGVELPVVVVVRIAFVAHPVPVRVHLGGVVGVHAVVVLVGHAVAVLVPVARVSDPVVIKVRLGGVRDQGAVVRVVRDAVPVVVVVACVAVPVPVRVLLVGVRCVGAVVQCVGDAVAVLLPLLDAREPAAEVAGVPEAVPIRVRLVRVGDLGAVVVHVVHAVVVVVGIHAVRHPVVGEVRVALVGDAVAVVVQPVADLGGRPLHRVALLGLPVEAVQDRVEALAQATGGLALFLVDIPVAVVVDAVADLEPRTLEGVAEHQEAVLAVVHRVEALAQAADRLAEAVVDDAVAVVVDVVADLLPLGVDERGQGVAVFVVGVAVVVVVRVHAVSYPVLVGVHEPLVDEAVAVVVDAVAELLRVGVDVGVQGGAVVRVSGEVVVVVVVARVPDAVEVKVFLSRVGDLGAVVKAVGHAVAVVIVGHAVGDAVAVGVREVLVRVAVAVVVLAVAGLLGRTLEGIAAVGRAVHAVRDRLLALPLAAGGLSEALVGVAVAVVVLAVAGLLGR